jgi:hypothetical protein
MRRRQARTRRALLALVLTLLAVGGTGGVAQAATWTEFPAPVPPGGQYGTAPGYVSDLQFWAPNRGLMAVGGNASVTEGLYVWNGQTWHQLSTVCGGGRAARIAWAGPTEFWVISRPSLPREQTAGLALCHFKDGEVVGSYSTPSEAEDPFRPMVAAACNGPSDCWFGGPYALDGLGRRGGAFHLHWDGATLKTAYGPQGRAVSDLLSAGGRWYESTNLGRQRDDPDGAVPLAEPEPTARLLHHLDDGVFANDPFAAAQPADTELLALAADGADVWAAGGGVSRDGQPAQRAPLVARAVAGGAFQELSLDTSSVPAGMAFVDVAPVPGTGNAWAAVAGNSSFGGESAQPWVARIDTTTNTATAERLTASDREPFKGAATRVACPAADDCWLATATGALYRLTGAPSYPVDTEPAFQGTITVRPDEAAEQAIPDDVPQDDSGLAVPPVDLYPDLPGESSGASCDKLPSLLTKVQSKVRGIKKPLLEVTFRQARTAKVGMTASRKRKVVARAKTRKLYKGNRKLVLKLSRKHWPTKLAFVIRDDAGLKQPCKTSSNNNNLTVVTP